MLNILILATLPLANRTGCINDTPRNPSIRILLQPTRDRQRHPRNQRLEHRRVILRTRQPIMIDQRHLRRNSSRPTDRTTSPALLDIQNPRKRRRAERARRRQHALPGIQIDHHGQPLRLVRIARQDLRQTRLPRILRPHDQHPRSQAPSRLRAISQPLERKVHVCITAHLRLFRDVLALRLAGQLERAAVPGVDGGFGAAEGVGLVRGRGELGAEELGGAGEEFDAEGRAEGDFEAVFGASGEVLGAGGLRLGEEGGWGGEV